MGPQLSPSRRGRTGWWWIALPAVAVTAIIAWVVAGGGTAPRSAPDLVATATRATLSVTVGAVGHVTTAGAPIVVGGSAQAPSAGATGPAPGAAGSVFPMAAGHVRRVLVRVGEVVTAGEPIAVIDDDGTAAANLLQARSDLTAALIDLRIKQRHDPASGQPATPQEVDAAVSALGLARARLSRLRGGAPPPDVAAARGELLKARQDLTTAVATRGPAQVAARSAVRAARARLATLNGAPDPVELAAAQADLARAEQEQAALLTAAAPPSPASVAAADAAVALAQQHVADATAAAIPGDVAAARAELAKAVADREALISRPPPPGDAQRTAAARAVTAAQTRVDALRHPAREKVAAAQADLARARADLRALDGPAGRASLAALRASVAAAQAKLAGATLTARDAISAAAVDVRRASGDLAALEQRGAPASPLEVSLSQARVSAAARRLALAKRVARRLTVTAPTAGTVTAVLAVTGSTADGTTPVARIQDLRRLTVGFDLSEFDVARVRVGAPATVTVDALGGARYRGRLTSVSPVGIDNGGVVTYPATVALVRAARLRPGMSVSVRVVVTRRRDVVVVPDSAVAHHGGHATVTVIRRGGATIPRTVTTGLTVDGRTEIRTGLRAGDRVAVPRPAG